MTASPICILVITTITNNFMDAMEETSGFAKEASATLSPQVEAVLTFANCEGEEEGIRTILSLLKAEDVGYICENDASIPIRYLRSKDGNAQLAVASIEETILFQKDYNFDEIRHPMGRLREDFLEDCQAKRLYVRGYDKEGRAILVSHTHDIPFRGDENTFKYVLYNVEKALACTTRKRRTHTKEPATFITAFDFHAYDRRYSVPLAMARDLLVAFSKHYPERCHKVYCIDAPTALWTTWYLAKPFINAKTQEKITFCTSEEMSKIFASMEVENITCLESFMGGTNPTDLVAFDAEQYMTLPLDVAFDEV